MLTCAVGDPKVFGKNMSLQALGLPAHENVGAQRVDVQWRAWKSTSVNNSWGRLAGVVWLVDQALCRLSDDQGANINILITNGFMFEAQGRLLKIRQLCHDSDTIHGVK